MATQGYKGQVRVETNVVAEVTSWTLDIERDMLETGALNLAGAAKTYLPGLINATGSLEMCFNMGDTNGQRAIQNALLNGTPLSLSLDTDVGGTQRTYSGTAYISSLSIENPVDDIVTASVEFQFTGPVTFT